MPFVGTNALTELWAKVKTRLDGKLGAKNANGYIGMTKPDGTDADYIRTTNSGIIPYASNANGSSYLGTSGWPFRSVSAREFRTGNDVLINETGVKESWLSWGGKNWQGGMSPVGVAMSTEHNPNRLAFINGDALTFEYSSNGGTSWTNYNYSAGVKSQVCTLSYSIPIGRPDGTTEYQIEQSKTRITLAAQGYVYTNPRKMLVRMSSSATCSMLVEYKTGQENATWQTFGTYYVSGWSGWNDIPLILGTLGGGSTQYSNNWFLRLTFHPTTKNTAYPKQCDLLSIRIYGDNDWNTASSINKKGPISGTGHLYSYDMNASATFPAQVTATQFNGPLSGNATTATSIGTESGVNTSINRLSTGSSDPTDSDYYIAQYAGGGTTTTTYHRRPHSALWNYIKGKISSVLGLTATNYGGKAATAGAADTATKAGVEDSFNTSTTIGASTDWDTITDAGWYSVASSSAWVADKHAPVGAYTYGMLSVSKKGKTGNIVVQTYNAHNNGKVYSRNKYNASDWTSWIELSANTWRGIQDNLTSDSATDSLSAKQGKALKTAVDAKYTKPSTGIPKTDLASAVQTSLGKADTALQEHQSLAAYATKTECNAKYTKPSTGIPKTDLASVVQTSLDKADTALQSHQSLAAYATKEDEDSRCPVVEGIETGTTGTWTGVVPLSEIKEGQRILFHLNATPSGNATLNLTLADGTTTGAKNCYYTFSGSRLTTHYSKGTYIELIYSTSKYNSSYVGWFKCGGDYNSDTSAIIEAYHRWTTDAVGLFANGCLFMVEPGGKVGSIVKTSANNTTNKVVNNAGFIVGAKVYRSTSAVGANTLLTQAWRGFYINSNGTFDFRYSSNCGSTLTVGKPVYLVGTITDNLFYLDSSIHTQTEPTTEDGKVYIYIGTAYSSTAVEMTVDQRWMSYHDGAFGLYVPNHTHSQYATKTYASDTFQPKGSYATTTQLDSLKNNVVVFDTEYTFANDTYTFTPKVWKNGEDITSTVAAAKFTWKMNDSSGLAVKTASGVKTFTVAKDEIHYVGSVVCECDL